MTDLDNMAAMMEQAGIPPAMHDVARHLRAAFDAVTGVECDCSNGDGWFCMDWWRADEMPEVTLWPDGRIRIDGEDSYENHVDINMVLDKEAGDG